MSKTNYGQNMLLHTSYWGDKDTFKLMPLTSDCPFSEVIYDPNTTLLVVINKHGKDQFQMVPKLDDEGEQIRAKKPKANGKGMKEQRITMQILTEHYLTNKEEQESFIKQFAVNAEEYDYGQYLRDMDQEPTLMAVESAPLTDAQGMPLKTVK